MDGESDEPGATTPPNVSLKSVLITSTVEEFEGREVIMVHITGKFIIIDMDEGVTMYLQGSLVELIMKTAQNIYSMYITLD
jgi:hypothetical protein